MSMTEDKAEVEAAWEHVGVLREVVDADEYAWWYVIFGGPPQGSQLTATEAAAWAAAAAFTREHVEKVRRARFDCLHVARFRNASKMLVQLFQEEQSSLESWERILALAQAHLASLLIGMKQAQKEK